QRLDLARIAAEDLEEPCVLDIQPAAPQALLQQVRGEGDGAQRRSQVVRDEGEVLGTPALDLARLALGERLDRASDRIVEELVEASAVDADQRHAVALGEVVDA